MKAVLIWIFVATPLVWGVTQSIKKSLPLFQTQQAVEKPKS
jgi:hypothetical protein